MGRERLHGLEPVSFSESATKIRFRNPRTNSVSFVEKSYFDIDPAELFDGLASAPDATFSSETNSTPVWLSPPVPFRSERNASGGEAGLDAEQEPSYLVHANHLVREFLVATIDLQSYPYRDDSGRVHPDRGLLRECEQAIDTFAQILSISHKASISICSPTGNIAFLPESEEERAWLEGSAGVASVGRGTILAQKHYTLNHSRLLGVAWLDEERIPGLQLLSEALSQRSDTGEFRGLVQYFEHAFALQFGRLIPPLNAFLRQSGWDFEGKELEAWKASRGRIIHGDRLDVEYIASDVKRFLPRMELAAYDLLLFKKQWHNACFDRRSIATADNVEIHSQDVIYQNALSYEITDPNSNFGVDLSRPDLVLEVAGSWREPDPDSGIDKAAWKERRAGAALQAQFNLTEGVSGQQANDGAIGRQVFRRMGR